MSPGRLVALGRRPSQSDEAVAVAEGDEGECFSIHSQSMFCIEKIRKSVTCVTVPLLRVEQVGEVGWKS